MTTRTVAAAHEALEKHFDGQDRFDQAVPLTLLMESGHNARHKFHQDKLEELAASIREKGVIEPLVVRPFELGPAQRYEIVAGARRFRASKLAGRTAVPCVIRDYSDSDVLELQIIENIQREDLDPLEEAAGYAALIKSNPSRYSAGFIADRIGRHEKYVWDRMRLLNLVDDAKQLLEAGRLTVGHAVALSRLSAAKQKDILTPSNESFRRQRGIWTQENALPLDDVLAAGTLADVLDESVAKKYRGLKPVSVRELEHYITDHVRFNPKQAAEVAPLEFGAVAEQVALAEAKQGRGKKVINITRNYHVADEARDPNDRIYTEQSWKRADGQDQSKPCEHAVLGVVTVGNGYGSAFDVCISKDKCDVHWKSERRAKAQNEKLRSSGQTEKANKQEEAARAQREKENARVAEMRAKWETARPRIVDALIQALRKVKPSALAELVAEACDGYPSRRPVARKAMPAKHRADDILRQVAMVVLLRKLYHWDGADVFPKIARQYGVDVKKILAAEAKRAKQAAAKEHK